MNNFILEQDGKVVFGRGCVKEYLASFVAPYGGNVLLAYGDGWAKRSGVYDQVYRILRESGKAVTEFSHILPGPTWAQVLEGARLARDCRADLVLALGGGSVVDCCKAVSMAAVYAGDLWADYWAQQGAVDFDPLPLGAVITAPGAGSGMNGRAVITNEDLGERSGRDYPGCGPRFVLMDPAYTLSVPQAQMAAGGFEALSRLMEVYFSPPDRETVTDDLAEGLMRGLIRDLRAAADVPGDYNARSNLLWEAALTGDRLLKLGKRTDFPLHRMARRLEADTGASAAALLAVIQPACYRLLCRREADRFARFARRVWDIPEEGRAPAELALAGARALEKFVRELGLSASLGGLGIPDAGALEAAALPLPPLSREEVLELLRQCL